VPPSSSGLVVDPPLLLLEALALELAEVPELFPAPPELLPAPLPEPLPALAEPLFPPVLEDEEPPPITPVQAAAPKTATIQ
jgi:hypothetical protein